MSCELDTRRKAAMRRARGPRKGDRRSCCPLEASSLADDSSATTISSLTNCSASSSSSSLCICAEVGSAKAPVAGLVAGNIVALNGILPPASAVSADTSSSWHFWLWDHVSMAVARPMSALRTATSPEAPSKDFNGRKEREEVSAATARSELM